ncbi:MAG: alpha/beta fold hydrolase [Verrucomicrobia bacterium]|nr:alpha/beta fold hydrolase [Verrucomicrobiota bacterium]
MTAPDPKAVRLSGGPRPVLCLHGFLGGPDDWAPLARALGPGFGVTAWTLPGHGAGPAIPFRRAVDEIAEFLRSLPVPAHVVGYSMGGRLALAVALRRGVPTASVVAISASPGLPTTRARTTRAHTDDRRADALERDGLAAFVRAWYAQPLFASLLRRPALAARLRALRSRGEPGPRAAALRALTVGRQPSLWPRLADLDAPVLFVAGAEDASYDRLMARAARLCPRGRLLTVPGAGHMPHLERPAFANRRIAAFIRGNNGDRR